MEHEINGLKSSNLEDKNDEEEKEEDSLQDIDNWKNCHKQRLEYIIERGKEVKNIVLPSSLPSRRSSTFDEIRKRRGLKSNVPIYKDDSSKITQTEIENLRYSISDDNSSIIYEKDLAESTSTDVDDDKNDMTYDYTMTGKN